MKPAIRYQSQLLIRRGYKPATRYHFRPRPKQTVPEATPTHQPPKST